MQKRVGAWELDIYIALCGAADTASRVLPSIESKGIQAGIDTDQAHLEERIRRGLAVACNQPHSGMFRAAVAHVKTGAADWARVPRELAESP